jgi:hypothetical protein
MLLRDVVKFVSAKDVININIRKLLTITLLISDLVFKAIELKNKRKIR